MFLKNRLTKYLLLTSYLFFSDKFTLGCQTGSLLVNLLRNEGLKYGATNVKFICKHGKTDCIAAVIKHNSKTTY